MCNFLASTLVVPIPTKPVPLTIGEIATRVSVVIALLVTIGMIIYRVILYEKNLQKLGNDIVMRDVLKLYQFQEIFL